MATARPARVTRPDPQEAGGGGWGQTEYYTRKNVWADGAPTIQGLESGRQAATQFK